MVRALIVVILSLVFISMTACVKEPGKESEEAPLSQPVEVEVEKQVEAEGSAEEQEPPEAAAADQAEPEELTGTIFGVPVPLSNYYFAKMAVARFSAVWRSSPKTEEELEDLTWQELVLSLEAFRRSIEATQQEKEDEIVRMLKADQASFDWKEDKEAYAQWVKDKVDTSVVLFENMIDHLIKLRKLREEVFEELKPQVTEEEARQKFLDEYNTLSVELRRFDELDKAKEFYAQAIKPSSTKDLQKLIWDDLILSYEAEDRGLGAVDKDVEYTIRVLLQDKRVDFNAYHWNKDEKDAYQKWVKDTTGLSPEEFETKMAQLRKINNLTSAIFAGSEPEVAHEKYQRFLDKSGSIEKVYKSFLNFFKPDPDKVLVFADIKKADKFYQSIDRSPGAWQKAKRNQPSEFKRPGFVSLDFLINLWGFDRKAAYAMLDKKEGSFYEPASIYKGYAVFKVLQIRKADIQDYDQARKEQYLERVTSIKKHRMFKEWKSNMVEAANIEVYLDGQRSSFASPQDTSAKDTERKRSAVTGHTKEESDGGE